ncbi:MAG: hypothetical protein ACLFOZ_18655, partial [Cyclobacteriaceae bacterium]
VLKFSQVIFNIQIEIVEADFSELTNRFTQFNLTASHPDNHAHFRYREALENAKLIYQITYDPKEADGTPEEAQRYDERCRQLATEMCYLMQPLA